MIPRFLIVALLIISGLTGCSDSAPVIHDLSDKNFKLMNEDSAAINFPDDFENNYVVVGFIYTHCPDICPVTTANMKNAFNMLDDTSDVHFVEITFDPRRDSPSVLKKYKQNFRLPENQFTMLTGEPSTVDSLLGDMGIEAGISYRDTTKSGTVNYFMMHTDRISIMDKQGRVRFEYPGSKVPPEHIVEDLNKIRGGWF